MGRITHERPCKNFVVPGLITGNADAFWLACHMATLIPFMANWRQPWQTPTTYDVVCCAARHSHSHHNEETSNVALAYYSIVRKPKSWKVLGYVYLGLFSRWSQNTFVLIQPHHICPYIVYNELSGRCAASLAVTSTGPRAVPL